MVSLQNNLLSIVLLLHFIPGEPVTMNAIFRQQDELGALSGSLPHLKSERLLEELQKQLEGSKLFTFAVRTPRLLEITLNERSKTHLWQEKHKNNKLGRRDVATCIASSLVQVLNVQPADAGVTN